MKNINIQIQLMLKRRAFIITIAVMSAFAIIIFIYNCLAFYDSDIVQVKAAKYLFLGSDFMGTFYIIYSLLFPVAAALPFADSFFEEREGSTGEYCVTRISNNAYYFSKLVVVFISGFIVNAVPLLINMLLNFIAFPLDSSIDATNFSYTNSHLFQEVMETGLFQDLFAGNMYLYNLLYLALSSFVCGLVAVIVYQLSFFYKKSRIFLIVSFFAIYHFLTVLLKAFGLGEFCIENYIFAAKFYCGQSVRGMITTFTIMILAAVLPIPFAKRKLNGCYD